MRDDRGQPARKAWADADYRRVTARTPKQATPAFLRVLLAVGLGCFALSIIAAHANHSAPATVFLALGFLLVGLFTYGLRLESIPRELRALGLCPACLYDLSAFPPDPDRCTLCPECGAAWRLPSPSESSH